MSDASDARFLSNIIAYVCADDDEIKAEVEEALHVHGGHVLKVYDPEICTHVIAAATSMASQEGRNVYTDLWLRSCINEGAVIPLSAPLHHAPISERGIPGADKLVLCLTGFTGDIRRELQFLAGLIGAGFSKPLKVYEVTHLICYEFSGDKYTVAKARGIKTVNHHWLCDCYMQWRLLPEERYQCSSKALEDQKQASVAQLPLEAANTATDDTRAVVAAAPRALTEHVPSAAEAGAPGPADVKQHAPHESTDVAHETMEEERKRIIDEGSVQTDRPFSGPDQLPSQARADAKSAAPHLTAAGSLHLGLTSAEGHGKCATHVSITPKEKCAAEGTTEIAQQCSLQPPSQAGQAMEQLQPNPCLPSLPPAEPHSAAVTGTVNAEGKVEAYKGGASSEQAVQKLSGAKDEVGGLSVDHTGEAPAQGTECLGPHLSPADVVAAWKASNSADEGEEDAKRCALAEVNDATRLDATEDRLETKRSGARRGRGAARARGRSRGRGKVEGTTDPGECGPQHEDHGVPAAAPSPSSAHSPALGKDRGGPNRGGPGMRGGRRQGAKRRMALGSPRCTGAEELFEADLPDGTTTRNASQGARSEIGSGGHLDGAKDAEDRASSKRAKKAAGLLSRAQGQAKHQAEYQANAEAVPSPERSRDAPEAIAALPDPMVTDATKLLDSGGHPPATACSPGHARVEKEANEANPKESPQDEWAEVDVATAQQAGLCSGSDGTGDTLQLGCTNQSPADVPGAASGEEGTRKDQGQTVTVALGDTVSPPAVLASAPLPPSAPCPGRAQGPKKRCAPEATLLAESEAGAVGKVKRKGTRAAASGPRREKTAEAGPRAGQGKAHAARTSKNDLPDELKDGPAVQESEPGLAASKRGKRGRPVKADLGEPIMREHTAGDLAGKVSDDSERESGLDAEAEDPAGASAPKQSKAMPARSKKQAAPARKNNKPADPFDFNGTQEVSRLNPDAAPRKASTSVLPQCTESDETSPQQEPERSSRAPGPDPQPGPGRAPPLQTGKQRKGAKGRISAVLAQQPKEQVRWFSFGGIGEEKMREELKRHVVKLGGRVCGGSQKGSDDKLWDKRSTHVILGAPLKRTEKLLGAAAAGRWILQPEYIRASAKAHKFLPEEDFEWSGAGLNDDGTVHLSAPRWWREQRQRRGLPAFHGTHVALLDDIGLRAGALERALAGGCATVHLVTAAGKAPTRAFLQKLDFLVMAPDMTDRTRRLGVSVKEFGGACVAPDFFVEWIAKAGLDGVQQPGKEGHARLLTEYLKAHVLLDSSNETCAALERLLHAHEDPASLLDEGKEPDGRDVNEEADDEGSIDLGGSGAGGTRGDAEGDSAQGPMGNPMVT